MNMYILSALTVLSFVSYAFYYNFGDSSEAPKVTTEEIVQVATVTPPVIVTAPAPVKPDPVVKPAVVPPPVVVVTPVPTAPVVPEPVVVPPPPVATLPKGQYIDGTYTGNRVNNSHGYVQVQAVILDGKLVDVPFLEYPKSGDSGSINRRANPKLVEKAIALQGSKVSTVSGATDTSGAFRKSLESALVLARNS